MDRQKNDCMEESKEPHKKGGSDTGQDEEKIAVEDTRSGETDSERNKQPGENSKSFLEVIKQPEIADAVPVVEIDMETIKKTEKEWGPCLVGSFQGVIFKSAILHARLSGIWITRAPFHVIPLDSGYYLFKFDDEEDCQGALIGGPWFVGQRRLMLQSWSIDFDPTRDRIAQALVWVRMPNLPLRFWCNDIIVYMATAVGKVRKLDNHTAEKTRLRFARVCVDINLDKPLVKGVRLRSPTVTHWQEFIYEDLPEICSYCMYVGHTLKMCNRKADKAEPSQETDGTRNEPASQESASQGVCLTPSEETDEHCIRKWNLPNRIPYSREPAMLMWKPPTGDWVKLNFDGSAKTENGRSGGGGIIRNNMGEFVACYSAYFGKGSNDRAELMALVEGLKLAKSLNWKKIVLEGDSMHVTKLMNNESKPGSKLTTILENAKVLLEYFSEWQSVHVPREINGIADTLAKKGSSGISSTWKEEPPDFISNSLYEDKVSVPRYRFR